MTVHDPKNPIVRSRLVTPQQRRDQLVTGSGTLEVVSTGDELLEERRRRRRAGDPRITPAGREILMRLVAGDLMGAFQAELDRISTEDPDLGGEQSGG